MTDPRINWPGAEWDGTGEPMTYAKPDIEFKRKVMVEVRPGHKTPGWRTYGHIYWRPFIVHLLGRTIIGRKHLG